MGVHVVGIGVIRILKFLTVKLTGRKFLGRLRRLYEENTGMDPKLKDITVRNRISTQDGVLEISCR